jgi:hypothetical protein
MSESSSCPKHFNENQGDIQSLSKQLPKKALLFQIAVWSNIVLI